ncbi:YhzD family protein [Bacillus swezeyi]|uniref:YhzD-like protein n=1 Tax=Bacillus swezeyi TaxID=1925020 RepID=A0A1R1QN59_9BACI|nr:YhzD family protein [Bacillus swezeyi]MEC1261708.1 YhzD family protein [Bacillus swezeyi]MED2926429.1 YhzD family protein [Bacillus swezeyi]MED2943899.1 YhzD family protein [Bacillus swezeyi]MED2966008.1 YhzD family protein [Bacillus swezeyi]MED3070588.1 YhzD family protein [Bacillus swezeyi]
MESYYVTVFDPSGETLLNERFEALNEEEAKEKGKHLMKEKQFSEHTHRVVHSSGKMIVFHR